MSGRPKRSRVHAVIRLGVVLLPMAALLCGFAYWWFWLRWPAGSGPAGPPVSRGAFSEPWTTRPVLLLGIGDSVTAGLGARPGWSYFDRLAKTPPEEFDDVRDLSLSMVAPALQVTNLAVSGSTSLQHWEKQFPRLPDADTNTLVLVVLTTGGNDIIQRYGLAPPREGAMYGASWEQAQPWIANFETRLNAMLDRLAEKYPGHGHVFLANIYDPTDGSGKIAVARMPDWPDGPRIHAAYNQIIARAARQREPVHLVDTYSEFLGHGFRCAQFWSPHYRGDDPHYWYYMNIEDPNERGYDALRRLFLNRMIEVLAP